MGGLPHDDVCSDNITAAAEMRAQGFAVNGIGKIGNVEIGLHDVLSMFAQAFQQ